MASKSFDWFFVPKSKFYDILCQMSWHQSQAIETLAFYKNVILVVDTQNNHNICMVFLLTGKVTHTY